MYNVYTVYILLKNGCRIFVCLNLNLLNSKIKQNLSFISAHERSVEDLEIIYEELLHIKALSHLSTMVKRELASVLVFESHAKAGTVCE